MYGNCKAKLVAPEKEAKGDNSFCETGSSILLCFSASSNTWIVIGGHVLLCIIIAFLVFIMTHIFKMFENAVLP